MKHIFGPVPSRRLGVSLGIDPVPRKVCSFDCIYCEVARTSLKTIERKVYVPTAEILADLQEWLDQSTSQPDYITISGSGEPTLHSDIGEMIRQIKSLTTIPVVVITNGSLLYLPAVRQALLQADVVLPSLDAATPDTYAKINRPHPEITLERLIKGIRQFRQEYRGQLWLEILIVKDVNNSLSEYQALAETVPLIHPDKIHLNTVSRPSGAGNAQPVTIAELTKLQKLLGAKAEIIASFSRQIKAKNSEQIASSIYELLKIRACTCQEMAGSIGIDAAEIAAHLNRFMRNGKVAAIEFQGQTYYKIPAAYELESK